MPLTRPISSLLYKITDKETLIPIYIYIHIFFISIRLVECFYSYPPNLAFGPPYIHFLFKLPILSLYLLFFLFFFLANAPPFFISILSSINLLVWQEYPTYILKSSKIYYKIPIVVLLHLHLAIYIHYH